MLVAGSKLLTTLVELKLNSFKWMFINPFYTSTIVLYPALLIFLLSCLPLDLKKAPQYFPCSGLKMRSVTILNGAGDVENDIEQRGCKVNQNLKNLFSKKRPMSESVDMTHFHLFRIKFSFLTSSLRVWILYLTIIFQFGNNCRVCNLLSDFVSE